MEEGPNQAQRKAQGQDQDQNQGQTKKKDKKPKNIVIPPKKPKLSKAERRALQEAQRSAKGLRTDGSGGKGKNDQKQKQQGADKDGKGKANAKADANGSGKTSGQEEKDDKGGNKKDEYIHISAHIPTREQGL